jgi:hypothetical protein
MMIPLPGARVVCVVGEPVSVPRAPAREEREAGRAALEAKLRQVTREADRRAGRREEDR